MINYSMNNINELLMKYRDVINQVFTLSIRECGGNCIVRVLNWSVIGEIRNAYALMIDAEDFQELTKRPTLINELLKRNLRRLILYPCFKDEIKILEKLGFIAINYVVNKECPLTKDVVIPPNAYDAVQMSREGHEVYIHMYNLLIRKKQIPKNLLDDFFEYLQKHKTKVNIILSLHSSFI